ncbi:MAG TPA: 4-aminobutyrate--2-oxoglutarate transaminase, partial [Enterobacteriaceae bacterium]|nr:4-aminobutyrate--2-oxoglutarate transaminase [Enterobacteriaceae bacterium]
GLGGTYAGNPLAIASAHAVLDVIDDEKLCQRANELGAQLTDVLEQAQSGSKAIAQVRGLGSMIAVEFNDPETGKPSAEITREVQQAALDQGLLLLSCGVYGNVIRFLYPLTIPQEQFTRALTILKQVLPQ